MPPVDGQVHGIVDASDIDGHVALKVDAVAQPLLGVN
jgi:hypothetical protein